MKNWGDNEDRGSLALLVEAYVIGAFLVFALGAMIAALAA